MSPSDWGHVTEASWPYDEAIGVQGVAPFVGITASMSNQEQEDQTRQLFLDAIERTSVGVAQKHLAYGFWFYTTAGHRVGIPVSLPLPVVLRLARLDSEWLYGDVVAEIVAPHASPDAFEDIEEVGCLCRLEVRVRREKGDFTTALTALLPLAEPGANGVVRLLASLVLQGAPPPDLDLDPDGLDESGRAALLLIDMHKVPPSPSALVERMAALLTSPQPGIRQPSIQPLLAELLSRKEPVEAAARVAPLIVHDARFPFLIREAALDILTDLAQRTDSGLASKRLRKNVGLSLPLLQRSAVEAL